MNNKGFTIIELMISLSILVFMIVGMTIAFQQQTRQFHITKESADIDQTARSTLDYIATEIRNAGSRQGKTFSIDFTNNDDGPDSLTIYTWDLTRGQEGDDLPSTSARVMVEQASPSLKLTLPLDWFPDDSNPNILIGEEDAQAVVYLGFRAGGTLCSPSTSINCSLTPEKCTVCSAILEASIDGSTKTATISDASKIKQHNFPISSFDVLSDFINPTVVGNAAYGFLTTFSGQYSEMTIVDSKTISVNTNNKELELTFPGENPIPIAGGINAPGIVDFQLVFNLQSEDGSIIKVGTPFSDSDKSYPDFTYTAVLDREQDIRSVEIYIVTKSRLRPQKISGGAYHQTIPAIGDVDERSVSSPGGTGQPAAGYLYRTFSTTVYIRNLAREEFG